jgi:hypothetical protein
MTSFVYPNKELTQELLNTIGDAEKVIFNELDYPIVNGNLKLPTTVKKVQFNKDVFYNGFPKSVTTFKAFNKVDASQLQEGIEKLTVRSIINQDALPDSLTSLSVFELDKTITRYPSQLKELYLDEVECCIELPYYIKVLSLNVDYIKDISLPPYVEELILTTDEVFCDDVNINFNENLKKFTFVGCINGQEITHHNCFSKLNKCTDFYIETNEINSICYPPKVEKITIKLYNSELSEIDDEYLDGLECFDFTPYQHLISEDDPELYRKVVYLLRAWNGDNKLPSTLRELDIVM